MHISNLQYERIVSLLKNLDLYFLRTNPDLSMRYDVRQVLLSLEPDYEIKR